MLAIFVFNASFRQDLSLPPCNNRMALHCLLAKLNQHLEQTYQVNLRSFETSLFAMLLTSIIQLVLAASLTDLTLGAFTCNISSSFGFWIGGVMSLNVIFQSSTFFRECLFILVSLKITSLLQWWLIHSLCPTIYSQIDHLIHSLRECTSWILDLII